MTAPTGRTPALRRGRAALGVSFFVQGAVFALLVTRIPAIQDRYGVSDGLLPAFLAAVPVLAGVGSLATERVVKRVRPGLVLWCSQPVACLMLVAVGSFGTLAPFAVTMGVFGLSVGALDASMNMLGVSLQRAYGRSIMLGFHAVYSLGGIVGASLAWWGAHQAMPLVWLYGPVVAVLGPAALLAGRWYPDAGSGAPTPVPATVPAEPAPVTAAGPAPVGVGLRLLLPLCLVMAFAYIGDSTVSNWSAKYLRDVLGGSEQLATVPYNLYMVTALLGRAVGDVGVRRFGAVAVVRCGTVLAVLGFGVVAAAPGPWWGMAGFGLLGLGLCVIVPQTFAAAGRLFPEASDTAVARLNVFNYVGFLVGSPLVGVVGDAWSYRGAMAVPLVLVAVTLLHARSFGAGPARYGGGHERPRTADVGRSGHPL
ncbi:MFS transporter [Streptomyces sp. NPDC059740]|uniref:MFS transporter n=1 Tax=Streptomyces sp. NPDC059740 TaxID=3346926 RepID=UPI00365F6158